MKIVIFGSTGMTGLCAIEAAIKKGYQVRAFVRDPSKLPEDLKSKVEVVKGDVLEADSVTNAIDGTDAVVIALGTRGNLDPTSDMSEGTKNIVDAMRAKHVTTVSACISAFLFYDDDKVPERFIPLTKDHKRMYEELKGSGLNWIAVFSPHISGKTEAGREFQSLLVRIKKDEEYRLECQQRKDGGLPGVWRCVVQHDGYKLNI